jgi:DNA-binding NtrC family response regulator
MPAAPQILIVEDEMMIALMLREMLEEAGCTPFGIAVGCAEALAIIESEASVIGAVMLDVNLQGESCEAVAAALDELGIPFIVTTGYADLHIPPFLQKRPTVSKPYITADVRQALASLGLQNADGANPPHVS